MIILGIETTCDETAISILKISPTGRVKILSGIVSSQIKIHSPFGGVVPSLAKREHQKNLIPVLSLALKESKLFKKRKEGEMDEKKRKMLEKILERDGVLLEKTISLLEKIEKPKIDLIAISYGPGLEPALWPGINLTRALNFYWDIDIERVNHLEAHIVVNWLSPANKPKEKDFPMMALIVSGGHTQLVLVKNISDYKIIGETRDDAAGECFDKTARLLGLSYPGGPAISKEAAKFKNIKKNEDIKLPRPMLKSADFDFSFSGLKTAVLYLVEKLKRQKKDIKKLRSEISNEIQEAIIDVLVEKTIKAGKKYKVKQIILAGGVSANKRLRERMAKTIKKDVPNIKFLSPEIRYSTDNGVMISLAAYFQKKFKKNNPANWKNLKAKANLRI